jgi:hypothetical protein
MQLARQLVDPQIEFPGGDVYIRGRVTGRHSERSEESR